MEENDGDHGHEGDLREEDFDAKRSPFGVCLTPVQCIHYALDEIGCLLHHVDMTPKEQVDAAVGYESPQRQRKIMHL